MNLLTNLLILMLGLIALASASPTSLKTKTTSCNNNDLVISDPANLTAASAFAALDACAAASHTDITLSDSDVHSAAASASTNCGTCVNLEGRIRFLSAHEQYACNTLPDGEKYLACSNQWCGICMIFEGQQCSGNMLHWGGPMEGSQDVKGGQSHLCL